MLEDHRDEAKEGQTGPDAPKATGLRGIFCILGLVVGGVLFLLGTYTSTILVPGLIRHNGKPLGIALFLVGGILMLALGSLLVKAGVRLNFKQTLATFAVIVVLAVVAFTGKLLFDARRNSRKAHEQTLIDSCREQIDKSRESHVNPSGTGYITGKVIIVYDAGTYGHDFIDAVTYDLPSEMLAETPDDIGTIVLENWVGSNDTYFHIKVIDKKLSTVVATHDIRVGDVDAKNLAIMDSELVRYLTSLPKK